MPPLHDPIPYDRIAELIGDTESSRQSAVLHDAWREYAATAARPYAWKTFSLYTRRHLMEGEDWSLKRGKALAPRPAFSSSAHMPPCACAAARSKSSMVPTTTARLSASISTQSRSRARFFLIATENS